MCKETMTEGKRASTGDCKDTGIKKVESVVQDKMEELSRVQKLQEFVGSSIFIWRVMLSH